LHEALIKDNPSDYDQISEYRGVQAGSFFRYAHYGSQNISYLLHQKIYGSPFLVLFFHVFPYGTEGIFHPTLYFPGYGIACNWKFLQDENGNLKDPRVISVPIFL
jgi:hypothetical protein